MMDQMQIEMPVYLFTGFLEAGKTTVIRNTLTDPEFNAGEKTLLLVCEEGGEEYDATEFPEGTVDVVFLSDPKELTAEYLLSLQKQYKMQRMMVEYNGMWTLDAFYTALPDGWFVYQELFFADSAKETDGSAKEGGFRLPGIICVLPTGHSGEVPRRWNGSLLRLQPAASAAGDSGFHRCCWFGSARRHSSSDCLLSAPRSGSDSDPRSC